jgi:hypothetical protein
MRIHNRVTTCLLIALGTFSAQTAWAGAGWSNAGVISEVNQQPGAGSGYGGEVFVVASVTGNTSGCSSTTGFYFLLSDERHRRMFAMLLTAQAAGRPVKIYFTGTCHVWGSAFLDGVIVVS